MPMTLPTQGFLFWPVGTGDSTTVCIADGVVMQIDLHHLGSSTEADDPHSAIVNELVKLLPERNGRPYLSTFVLTHPDKDHTLGFAELLKRVTIGEIWLTPRVFREYKTELAEDAVAFREEAERRIDQTISEGALPDSGDRVRIFGYDDEESFEGFPAT